MFMIHKVLKKMEEGIKL